MPEDEHSVRLPFQWSDLFAGGYHLVILLITVVGFVVYQVRSDTQRDSLLADLDKQVARLEASDKALQLRADNIDVHGTRAMEVVSANMQRALNNIDRLFEKDNAIERRLSDVEGKTITTFQAQIDTIRADVKRLEEQQRRIIESLDNTYNTLTEFIRRTPYSKQDAGPTAPQQQKR